MADQKLRELTESTTPVSTDLVYAVVDPDGTPLDRKVEIGTLLGNLGAWVNLAMNSPGQIYGAGKDGNEPEWWDDVANATITDEDCAGEGVEEKTERCFKVVTTADDVYGYQTLTFANESLLDAGETVVSFSCWVWCDAASTASIGIYGTNLGLQESDQHAGDSAWHLLTVENITLDAADASIQLRLIVDTDTAYFTMPMLNVGSCSLPWTPRSQQFYTANATAVSTTSGDVAWSDLDMTAHTHPLATMVQVHIAISEPDGSTGSYIAVAHSDDIAGADAAVDTALVVVLGDDRIRHTSLLQCNDGQVVRYTVSEADADNDVAYFVLVRGYWRWAP